jgi:hypothetical protein
MIGQREMELFMDFVPVQQPWTATRHLQSAQKTERLKSARALFVA